MGRAPNRQKALARHLANDRVERERASVAIVVSDARIRLAQDIVRRQQRHAPLSELRCIGSGWLVHLIARHGDRDPGTRIDKDRFQRFRPYR